MNAPKVSILLPSLNQRQFLEARVESLLRQTVNDWKAIVLDSGSTDGSWEFFESVAKGDSRFRLYQIPREGLYAALNRGLELATGEFLHIAPSDDTMAPEFLAQMIEAFSRCRDAGVAACDCLFINKDGNELQAVDMAGHLSKRRMRNLLGSARVRASLPKIRCNLNYRPVPYDCLLHFTARSVYFSLTQLLVRTVSAKTAGFFETNASSAADFGWLVRLTSLTGTVHLPKKLATWRFHGDQLSLHRDDTRLITMNKACQSVLRDLQERYPGLLSDNECELLLLPQKTLLAPSLVQRVGCWLEGAGRVLSMFARRPLIILRALFRTGIGRNFPIAVVLQRRKLAPRDLDVTS
jgi:glycosyltransferase involved in cell wall biosynthesis